MTSSEVDVCSTTYLWGVTAQILNIFTEINDFSQEKKRDFGNIFPSLVRGLVCVNGRLYCVYVSMMLCPPTECVSFGSVLNAWHFCNNHRRKVLKSNFWKGLHVFLWFQTSCFMLCFELNHESVRNFLPPRSQPIRELEMDLYCQEAGLSVKKTESLSGHSQLYYELIYDVQIKVSHRWAVLVAKHVERLESEIGCFNT